MTQAIAGGLGIGAGVGLSSVALAPFNAANTFMGSAFFGYGMILGERYMYQADWPKIQQRLENGEKIENIIQEYTGTFTAVVMKEAKIIFDTVTQEFIAIMQQALKDAGIPIEHMAHGHLFGHAEETETELPPPTDPHKFLSPVEKLQHKQHGHLGGVPTPTPTSIPTEKVMSAANKEFAKKIIFTMNKKFDQVMIIDKFYHMVHDKTGPQDIVKKAAWNNLFTQYKQFVLLQKGVINYHKQFNITWSEKSYIPVF